MKLPPFLRYLFGLLFLAGILSNLSAQDMAQRALADTSFHWLSSAGKQVHIYYQEDSFAHQHRQMLLRSAAAALDEALEYLGIPAFDRKLRVFYLNSRAEMERVVGRPYSGFANWDANAVFVVVNPDWRSFEKHELTHVLTMLSWDSPAPSSSWMIEGIAIACDGWCREYSVDQIASHYLSQDMLPHLTSLFDDIRAFGEIRGGMTAASVIGYIHDTCGPAAVRDLWIKGTENLPAIIGVELDQLESAWHDYLRGIEAPTAPIDLDVISEAGCG